MVMVVVAAQGIREPAELAAEPALLAVLVERVVEGETEQALSVQLLAPYFLVR